MLLATATKMQEKTPPQKGKVQRATRLRSDSGRVENKQFECTSNANGARSTDEARNNAPQDNLNSDLVGAIGRQMGKIDC